MSKGLPIPVNEEARLNALRNFQILDSLTEVEYDRITRLAATICEVPIALISLVDKDRQWFKSKYGLDADETPREISICQYAIMDDTIFEVEDASMDSRFDANPLVTGDPKIRFYAGHPIDDDQGHMLGTLCVIDKVPRKLTVKQSEALKNLSAMVKDLILLRKLNDEFRVFRKFFDYSLDMLCIAGPDGYFKRLNPAFSATLGWTDEELMSRPFIEFVHEDDLESTLNEVKKLSEGVPTIDFQNRYKSKSGKWVWMHWTCEPDVNTGELYAVAHNISALMETNFELERAIKYKEIFLSNMSHEVRTPMNAIKGFADLLKGTPVSEEQKDYLDTISQATDHLLVVINDILDASKIESGKLTLDEKPFSLRELVDQVVKLNLNKAKNKGLKVITSIDEEVPALLQGDPVRISQILVNLLNNAIKFTHEGKVRLNVMLAEINRDIARIELEVTDTGIGIPDDKKDMIFERFEQVDGNTTRRYGGTGLGLSIVKMLVDLCGGEIEMESVVGKGTKFFVSIPFKIARNAQQANALINAKSTKDVLLSDIRILLVEDNAMNQKLATRYLERHDAYIELAENGVEAIDILRNGEFDVILMDLQMPEMDGYETTKHIRTQMKNDIPIIACTAHSLVGEQQHCLEVGMNSYISKPYSEEELIRSIYEQVNPESKKQRLEDQSLKIQIESDLKRLIQREGIYFVHELMDIYNERIPKDIKGLKDGCARHDLQLVKQKAHLVSSSLTTLEFRHGYEIGKQLEEAVAQQDSKVIKALCAELTDYLELTLVVTGQFKKIE